MVCGTRSDSVLGGCGRLSDLIFFAFGLFTLYTDDDARRTPSKGALPHYRQLRVFPVHHLSPAAYRAPGPDLSAKKSRSTLSFPISW